MNKNVAGQKLRVFAWDVTTGLPKAGDAANITAYVKVDTAAAATLGDTTATELDATIEKGFYEFDLTQAETNGDVLLFSAKSSTANVTVMACPPTVFTRPPNASAQSISAGGKAAASLAAGDVTGNLPAIVNAYLAGQAPLQPVTAGRTLDVDAAHKAPATLAAADVTGNLPAAANSIANNAITAAAIAAAALNGKGDWLQASGYTAPDNADIVTALTDLVLLLARTDPSTALTAVKAVTDKLSTMLAASGLNWTFTADAVKNAPTGGGGSALSKQDVADALKLAPAAGTPAAGSVYDTLAGLVPGAPVDEQIDFTETSVEVD